MLKPTENTPKEQIEQLLKLVESQKNTIVLLEEKIQWFERQLFGQRSEKFIELNQNGTQYFPGMEPSEEDISFEQDEPKSKKKKRKKRRPQNDYSNGLVIPDNLPVEQTVLDLSEEEKLCPETGEKMIKIGEEVTRKLAYRTGKYFVKEIVRPKYAIPSREESGIFIHECSGGIIPRCKADVSLLAEIVTKKFADHLPLHRVSEIFSRDNIQITRQLLSNWIIRLGVSLMPLYTLMLRWIKESGVVYVDESPVKLQVKGKGKLQQGYMWVLVGGGGGDPPYRVYKFCENRNHKHAYNLLEDYSGFMHSDKYAAYENLSKRAEILWQPCWVHIRRKFEEAKSGDLEFRKMVLRKIRYLFMFEKVAWSRSEEERLKIRKEKEAPVIDELIKAVKEKISSGNILPKSALGKALNYFYGLIPHLKNYHSHPNARMDNNVAERAVRPLAIGRKNWLFVGSMKGGEASAVLLSLVQTCRGLGINPQEYLEDVMQRLNDHPANRLDELLPDQWAALKAKSTTQPSNKPLHIR